MNTQNTSQQVPQRDERTITEFLFTTTIVLIQLLIVLQTVSDIAIIPSITGQELLSISIISVGVIVGNQLRHVTWPDTVSETVNVRGVTALIVGTSICIQLLIVTTSINNVLNTTVVSIASFTVILGIAMINMKEGLTRLRQSITELRNIINE